MRTQLVCRLRPGVTKTFDIHGPESVMGREPGIAVSVPLQGVSRSHARITSDGSSYWLEDLKSTNGTFLNGEAVVRERLRHLDVIALGKQAELVFVVRGGDFETRKRTGITRALLIRDAIGAMASEIPLGEFTIGRAVACNVVTEGTAISKLHARIVRTPEELTLEDLGSSNGTFVNGARIMTSALKDGDVISLAGVESYRVVLETGEVSVPTGPSEIRNFAKEGPSPEKRRFSNEWKTRFEWDSSENIALADVRRAAEERAQARASGQAAGRAPTILQPGKKAAGAAKPAAPSKPAAPATPAPPAPAKPTAAPPAVAKPTPPAVAPPAPPASPKAAPSTPAPSKVLEVSLSGSGFSFSVTRPGAYDMGRGQDAALRVANPTISRRHARITLSQELTRLTIEDLGGSNGTLVNGVAIEAVKMLASGDTITLGEVTLSVTVRTG